MKSVNLFILKGNFKGGFFDNFFLLDMLKLVIVFKDLILLVINV